MEKSQVEGIIIIGLLILLVIFLIIVIVAFALDKVSFKIFSKKDGMGVDSKPFYPDNTSLLNNPWDNIDYIVPTVKTFYNEQAWGQPLAQSYDIDMKPFSKYL